MPRISMLRMSCILLLFFSLTSCSRESKLPETRLVVVISVDQFWYPHLKRYGPHFTGGLKRLLNSSALFTNARFNFAITETAPGHATLVSGTYPATHGIVSNHWYDHAENKTRYCVEDSYYGFSPRAMRVTALPDWLKSESFAGKIFSVGGKDRSAILMAGRNAAGAFWYSRESGSFETSSYYNLVATDWLNGDAIAVGARKYFGHIWSPLDITELSYTAVGSQALDRGVLEPDFPYPLGKASLWPDRKFYESVYSSPFLDQLTWDFTRELILKENLGTREEYTDYLAISFAALDTVGHIFGPESKEAADVLFRLDRILEELFVLLEEKVGLENTLVILSSDHGVQPYPELNTNDSGRRSRRIHAIDIACVQEASLKIQSKLGTDQLWQAPMVLNRETIRSRRLSRTIVDAVVREALEDCAAIERVWTRDELLFGSASGAYEKLYKRSIAKGRGPDYFVQHPEGYLNSWPSGTTHGSPYDYDRHVPVFILAPGIPSARISKPVKIVDVAPTVASLLQLDVPRFVEGRSQIELLSTE